MNESKTAPDPYQAALETAVKQLSCRAMSAGMLRRKLLEKGHGEQEADYALAWLDERHYLNDAAYAESVVRACMRKGYGAARARQELSRRWVDRETAEEAMQAFSPNAEKMRAVLEKRLRGDVSDRREVEKAAAALQRRGFSWSEIRRALEEYGEALPEDN